MNRSVKIIGWSTIILSIIVICSNLFGMMMAVSYDQLGAVLNAVPQLRTGSLDTMADLVEYNKVWTVYSIVYFAAVLGGAILFTQYRESGRKILEIACWVGILNACIDSVMSYIFWDRTQQMMSQLAGGLGVSLAQLNPLGIGAIVLGFFLWVVPCFGMIFYLRRPALRALMKS